jgi:hypothetical protein
MKGAIVFVSKTSLSLRKPSTLLAGGLIALFCCSCGNTNRKPVFPVRGQVSFSGQFLPGALVVFHPLDEADQEAVRPQGHVGPDGAFALTTYEPGDGAPAGDYRVTVELWLTDVNGDAGPTSRLPARYAKPSSSGLTATVNAGPNDLQPFVLNP